MTNAFSHLRLKKKKARLAIYDSLNFVVFVGDVAVVAAAATAIAVVDVIVSVVVAAAAV